MIYVGIDVAKDKHDCFITNQYGEVVKSHFTIKNNRKGFNELYKKITSSTKRLSSVKVGIEATGHYSFNILNFLISKNLTVYVLNPLHTNLFRKGLSLRKTKTDEIDAKTIATMIRTNTDLKPYSDISRKNEDLKSLSRYRFKKVQERAKLKTSIARLSNILFPELETMISNLNLSSILALFQEYPGASYIANANLTKLSNFLHKASKGHFDKDFCIKLKSLAKSSIGSILPAVSLELKHTATNILYLNQEINDIDYQIKQLVDELKSPILSIPGISYSMGSLILGEIGDFTRFDNPDKLLAYAGLSPSTYQSGQLDNCYARMEKRGSIYLRYALFNATIYACNWDDSFKLYLHKKLAEGKHYYVAISHTCRKLLRVIFHLVKYNETYKKIA